MNPNENDHFIGITAHDIKDIRTTANVMHMVANVTALALV